MSAGRPLKYKTVAELQKAIDEYFDTCDANMKEIHTKEGDSYGVSDPDPYTMAGLAYNIGLSRQALMEYSHREQFGDTIKRARARVESDVEKRLLRGAGAGAIFSLKNNFGWLDQSRVDGTQEIRITTRKHKKDAATDT